VIRQWAGWSWVQFLAQESLPVLQNVHNDVAAHQASHSMDIRGFSLEVKQLGHEADHSIPSCAQVMNESSYTPILPQLAKGQLYLYVLHEI